MKPPINQPIRGESAEDGGGSGVGADGGGLGAGVNGGLGAGTAALPALG